MISYNHLYSQTGYSQPGLADFVVTIELLFPSKMNIGLERDSLLTYVQKSGISRMALINAKIDAGLSRDVAFLFAQNSGVFRIEGYDFFFEIDPLYRGFSGTVTKLGVGVENAVVMIISMTTREVVEVLNTNATGKFSTQDERYWDVIGEEQVYYHVTVDYIDILGKYNSESYPFVLPGKIAEEE